MHEVITLQFGENANYVGTHFWNTQEANITDSDELYPVVFYREGSGKQYRQKHTPRLLLFDKPGNFGSLGQEELASGGDAADQADALWSGQSETYRQPLYPKNEFIGSVKASAQTRAQDADINDMDVPELQERDIRFWSDFSETQFHSRTLHSISGVERGNSLGEMNTFHEGADVFEGEDAKQDVLESDFRHLAEECDHIQGFQVLADAFGGFSGYGTAFIARIRDEYPKSSIMLYSISNTTAKNTDGGYGMDTSISFAANLENVSMFVPLSTPLDILKLHPNVEIKESKFYQASALMALNVDTWSYSLLTRKRTLDEIVNQVTQQEYYTLAESLFAPGLQITSADSFSHFNDILERDFVSSTATSAAHDVGRMAGQLIVDRGAGISSLVSARYPAAAYARFDSPVRLSRAFPKIFRRINSQGFKTRLADHPEEEMRRELQRPQSVCVGGLLCTASSSESYLQQLHEWLRSESSRHLKDYERDSIREYRYALDSTIDKYAGI